MNALGSRIKAIGVTVVFFTISAFFLLAVIWCFANAPFKIPFFGATETYNAIGGISAVLNFNALYTLSAAYLMASAVGLMFDSGYADRMIAIFADVLLLFLSGMVGFIGGYWLFLRIAGVIHNISLETFYPVLICALIVFIVSLLPLAKLRNTVFIRVLGSIFLTLLSVFVAVYGF